MKYKDAESLKKNRDFQLVYKTGTSYVNKYLVMYARERISWGKTESESPSVKKWATVQCATGSADW